jgi:hypothetical protein
VSLQGSKRGSDHEHLIGWFDAARRLSTNHDAEDSLSLQLLASSTGYLGPLTPADLGSISKLLITLSRYDCGSQTALVIHGVCG